MTLRTKIEEAIDTIPIALTIEQEKDVVDKLCAIFEKETIKQVQWALDKFVSSLEEEK